MEGLTGNETILAGRYRRIRRLGTGGMASVLLAEDQVLGRQVAVKQLRSAAPEEALRRFRREARLGASLNHPNIVAIFDTVSDEDSVLIVMELVDGESLAERLKREPLDRPASLATLKQVASALDHAHAQGVVHRDVKPSNILIGRDGTAKLADLGIATAVDATAITGSGNVVGTLAYIAPERLRGDPGEAPADVYSFAAVAFELLSGRRAHPEKNPEELVRRIEEGAPDLLDADPDAPPGAAAVLRRAMSADPGERPETAGEVVRRLDAALDRSVDTQPVAATRELPATVPSPAPKPPRRDARPSLGERPPFVPSEYRRHENRRTRALVIAAIGVTAGLLIALVVLSGGDGGSERVAGSGAGSGQPANGQGNAPEPAPETTPVQEPPPPAPPPSSGTSGAALNEQGFGLLQEGRYEEAIPILQQAVDSYPAGNTDINYAFALFNLGNALRLAGRPEEAIPILEQRLEIPNQTATVQRELDLARADAAGE